MKKTVLVAMLIIGTIVILGVPVLLNIPCVSENVSWYFSGLRTPDYKMTYISFLGGIAGVWMTVGTTLLVQNIFDGKNEREKEKLIRQIVVSFLLEEIKKNHKAMTTCDSGMHKQVAKDKTVLQLVKDKEVLNVQYFQKEFSLSQWDTYSDKLFNIDIETYMLVSKLYDCYRVVKEFKVGKINIKSDFEKTGLYDYERIYKKFENRFADLFVEEN